VVSEGFHTLFHALCIWAAMIALSYTSKHESPDHFCPFGYSRAQIITAFGNSIFILFISFYSFFEAAHEILSGEASDSNQELLKIFSVKSLIHSLFFIHLWPYLFGKFRFLNDNLGVVALHCLGLLVTELIRVFSLYFEFECLAYPLYHTEAALNIVWIIVACLLIRPFLIRNGNILLLCSPSGKTRENIHKKIREISLVEGVVAVKEEKFWMINSSDVIGSFKVEVHGEGKNVVSRTQEIMKGTTTSLVVEIEKSD
jgi:Co/Zn/Cd efflux system component